MPGLLCLKPALSIDGESSSRSSLKAERADVDMEGGGVLPGVLSASWHSHKLPITSDSTLLIAGMPSTLRVRVRETVRMLLGWLAMRSRSCSLADTEDSPGGDWGCGGYE